jgi:hypothetical protein
VIEPLGGPPAASRPQLKRGPLDGGEVALLMLPSYSDVLLHRLTPMSLVLAALLGPSAAPGQRLSSTFPSPVPTIRAGTTQLSVPRTRLESSPLVLPRTYWLEAGVVGAIGLGVFGALVGHGLCADSDVQQSCTRATLGVGALGAGVGFTVGALIGGQVRKRASAPP